MDALALLKQEIEKKKQEKKEVRSKVAESSGSSTYIRKRDVERALAEEESKEARTREEHIEKTSAPEPTDDDDDFNVETSEDFKRLKDMSKKDVFRRLRTFDEPVTLFGETDMDRLHRLYEVQIKYIEQKNMRGGTVDEFKRALREHRLEEALQQIGDTATGSERSQKRRKVDADDAQATSASHATSETSQAADGTAHASGNDNEKGTAQEGGEDGETAAAAAGDKALGPDKGPLLGDVSGKSKEFVIAKFIKTMTGEWEDMLSKCSAEERQTDEWRHKMAMFRQTKADMKPLFKQLKRKVIEPDLLENLHNIVHSLQYRDYIQANDFYLRLAIGNAPWPMGVTMVGIHARSAREKISTSNVAHVFNNEVKRKYIQGMKRIMTVCQQLHPTAPSRMMG